jgi:hypothetical protein
MANIAKHIQVALKDGPAAGMEVFLNAPSSKRWPSYKAISSKRTDKTRLAAYCKQFAGQLGGFVQPEVGVTVEAEEQDDVQTAIAEIQAKIDALKNPQSIDDSEDEGAGSGVVIEAGSGQAGPVTSTVAAGSGLITRGIAWAVLNTDGTFPEPHDPDAPATNGQLYRLNVAGLMGEALAEAL